MRSTKRVCYVFWLLAAIMVCLWPSTAYPTDQIAPQPSRVPAGPTADAEYEAMIEEFDRSHLINLGFHLYEVKALMERLGTTMKRLDARPQPPRGAERDLLLFTTLFIDLEYFVGSLPLYNTGILFSVPLSPPPDKVDIKNLPVLKEAVEKWEGQIRETLRANPRHTLSYTLGFLVGAVKFHLQSLGQLAGVSTVPAEQLALQNTLLEEINSTVATIMEAIKVLQLPKPMVDGFEQFQGTLRKAFSGPLKTPLVSGGKVSELDKALAAWFNRLPGRSAADWF